MARWAVVRVQTVDGMEAQYAIVKNFAPVTMQVIPNPPAAGPEWEIRVQDVPLILVQAALDRARVMMLACKTELGEPLEPPATEGEKHAGV